MGIITVEFTSGPSREKDITDFSLATGYNGDRLDNLEIVSLITDSRHSSIGAIVVLPISEGCVVHVSEKNSPSCVALESINKYSLSGRADLFACLFWCDNDDAGLVVLDDACRLETTEALDVAWPLFARVSNTETT